MRRLLGLALCTTALSAPEIAPAPPLPDSGPPKAALSSPLAGLAGLRPGRPRRAGSWDRGGGNRDFRVVEPGQTLVLLDHQGAGVIRHFWLTLAPRGQRALLRQALLRMYWDDEAQPSVEAPLGDFFGVGFGEQRDYASLPMSQTSGGFTSYWPMPFHRAARWTLTNGSDTRIDALYFNIDFTTYDSVPAEQLHFHAQWHRENPVATGRSYTALHAVGRGHFVGLALFMQNRLGGGLGFLEGDESFYIDGEQRPSIVGTGTEDYFNGGWYFDRGAFAAPFHGAPLVDSHGGRVSAYRWHLEDALPFSQSLRVTLEHGRDNLPDSDYSSVAYWYQTEPHAPFPKLAALLPHQPPRPPQIAGAIEGESLVATARTASAAPVVQELAGVAGIFSDSAELLWRPGAIGAALELVLPVKAAGTYALTGYFVRAIDGARVALSLDGVPLGQDVDLYGPRLQPTGAVGLGRVVLGPGEHHLVLTIRGRDPRSVGYAVGLDALVPTPQ